MSGHESGSEGKGSKEVGVVEWVKEGLTTEVGWANQGVSSEVVAPMTPYSG